MPFPYGPQHRAKGRVPLPCAQLQREGGGKVLPPSLFVRPWLHLCSPYLASVVYPFVFFPALWRYLLLLLPCVWSTRCTLRAPKSRRCLPFPLSLPVGVSPPPRRAFCPVPVVYGCVFPFAILHSFADLWESEWGCGARVVVGAWEQSVKCYLFGVSGVLVLQVGLR